MQLPYSLDVYRASMAAYNADWLPLVLVAWLLAVFASVLALHPKDRAGHWASRFVVGYLATAWLWIGAVHQLGFMTELNFMAPVYGMAWIGQGLLLAWSGLYLGTVRFDSRASRTGAAAKVLTLIGLVIYPLLLILQGHDLRSLPVVGTAPNPTAVFTVGLLLASRGRPPVLLFIVPLAWAGVAGVTAYMLEHRIDYFASVAIVVAASLAVHGRFKRSTTTGN
jgi:hypothetical protein